MPRHKKSSGIWLVKALGFYKVNRPILVHVAALRFGIYFGECVSHPFGQKGVRSVKCVTAGSRIFWKVVLAFER